ncbi:stage II sporulation protein R [Paraliobacillus ryukyuensis]|uniref:stage II sporulation protein R n=1 Tax=Paraliobacillus ryukyuensis TaxID=200904 RepID=UPI0009A756E6|nr:stage II sporulation protein R [Paraliobacillus ryukyuensis]
MKKNSVLFITLFIVLFMIGNQWWTNQRAEASEYQVIPDEAIRLRILANSDDEEDQVVKRIVRDRVNQEINKWVEELESIEAARQIIQKRLPIIRDIVEQTLLDENVTTNYQVDYDNDVQFPAKVYGNNVYPAGEYEAILITLGKGEGANWWCVLFPPLCFLDFSNGTTVAAEEKNPQPEEEEVEVKFFFLEWFR